MHVLIIGSGIVGAAIAYELCQRDDCQITVVDRQPTPPQFDQITCPTATGAALGVLMAAISTKTKGRNLQMRLAGVDWYNRVIPVLEATTGQTIPVNRQGILMLEFEADRRDRWEALIPIRQAQNRHLEIWDPAALQQRCPHLSLQNMDGQAVVAGIYSPDDRQIHPVAMTQALITAAQKRGVAFRFGVEVQGATSKLGTVTQVLTNAGSIAVDRVVITAGLGSFGLTQALQQPVMIHPVLGQAIHLRLPQPLGDPDFQPVLTGNDIHLVPLDGGDYWVGATVEFAADRPNPAAFDQVMQAAIVLWPELAQAAPMRQWHGLRPRPEGRSAPVIEPLTGYDNVLLATAHYRNGVLLAPATAMAVGDWL
jgi:glycine oxidase